MHYADAFIIRRAENHQVKISTSRYWILTGKSTFLSALADVLDEPLKRSGCVVEHPLHLGQVGMARLLCGVERLCSCTN